MNRKIDSLKTNSIKDNIIKNECNSKTEILKQLQSYKENKLIIKKSLLENNDVLIEKE